MGGRGYSSATSRRGAGGQKDHYEVKFTPTRLEEISSTPRYLYGEAVSFTANLLGVDEERAREGTERKARVLEEYIDKAPKWAGGKTYRGIMADSLPKIGDVIDMGGTSSWSSEIEEAMDYISPNQLVYHPNSHRVLFTSPTQSKGTSIRHLAKYPHEYEVTASKNATFKVSGIRVEDGITYIDLKELR